jgi:ABC-type polysaccharide/polyol phosphate transport system ATPase subunit
VIQFDEVKFGYPAPGSTVASPIIERFIFHNVNFTLANNCRVALVGGNGSG